MSSNFKKKAVRDARHLDFIRSMPCVVCLEPPRSQACHVRRGTDGGMGLKPSDFYTVPMCPICHRKQHEIGELKFWYPFKGYEAAKALGKKLYKITGRRQEGVELVRGFKR